jgi:hypothetical protein
VTRRAVPKPAPAGAALEALSTLAVKGRAPRTGYDRALFGQAWADVDRNGCDTRNDILRRDLDPFVLKAGTRGCLVLSGTLHDPYTGRTIGFVRGQGTSTAVQIDHVVSLSDAWQKGAQRLDASARERFANDPLNLLAVDGPTNQRKGDGDAATWLPPASSYRCRYVARQVAVKARYRLWVTVAEKAAITRILARCPAERLPRAAGIPLGGGPERSVSSSSPSSRSGGTAGLVAGGSVYYQNCDAVRAAGAAPIRVGDPGYSRRLDRDGDGVGCE